MTDRGRTEAALGTVMSNAPGSRPRERQPGRAFRRTRSCFAWLFRNRQTGQITVAQFPNVALWIFFATAVLRRVVPAPSAAHTAVDWTAVVALTSWAVDEVIRGVNPWRRLLGLAGCAFAAVALASLLH